MNSPHMVISIKHAYQHVPQTYVMKQECCSIGRAWDNDIVILDAKCPLYIGEIFNNNSNLSIHYANAEVVSLLRSGDALNHKQTNAVGINVYLSNHPAPSLSPLSPLELLIGWLSKPRVAMTSALIYMAMKLWSSVQSQVRVIEWQNIIDDLVMEMIIALFMALMLATITKFSRQEKRFFTYLSIVTLFFLISYWVKESFSILYFNIPLAVFIFASAIISSLLLVTVASRFIISLMSNWSNINSWILALLLGMLSLYYNYGQHWLRNDEFSQSPKIITEVYPNFYRFISNSSIDEFMDKAEALFNEVGKLKDK